MGEDSEPPPITRIEKKGGIIMRMYKVGQDERLSNTIFSDQPTRPSMPFKIEKSLPGRLAGLLNSLPIRTGAE